MQSASAALDFVLDLGHFVTASPSSFHAAETMIARLTATASFRRLAESEPWPRKPGRYVVQRDGAVIAWVVPAGATGTTPFRIVGTHTDSPGFKLKPRPNSAREGWWQAGVEVYGGPLLNSWLDRELELAGRLVTFDGAAHLTRTGPLLRIPQLAIHLDRSANDGLTVNRQQHTQPVWGLDGLSGPAGGGDILDVLAAAAGVAPEDIGGYDIVIADTAEPRTFGAQEALFASGRLDNLLSTHAAMRALITSSVGADTASFIPVFAAFDHEEIGSATRSGAAGPFLADVLERIGAGLDADREEAHRAYSSSIIVSCDVGHSVHPNYPDKHDPENRPVAGGGPILKINADQRYTTDAYGEAIWRAACRDAGVPCQEFVSRNDITCGSTIGPLTATRLGIRTVDVGVPILSMHSARELTTRVDPWYLSRAMAQVWAA